MKAGGGEFGWMEGGFETLPYLRSRTAAIALTWLRA
jgi:hypothetical protein